MYCKMCGEIIADDCKFCPECGAIQQKQGDSEEKKVSLDKMKAYVGDVVGEFGKEIAKENLAKVEKSVSKKAKKVTHKVLVKAGIEKKNVADVIEGLMKKKR